MIADYHVHTPYCGHAQGRIIQYIETAIGSGMKEIGFSDHLGRYYLTKSQKRRYWDWGMNDHELARYYTEIIDLKEIFSDQINIKIGLEVDFIEGAEDILKLILDRYTFDFFLCSIHCLPHFGWRHLSNYKVVDPTPVYKEYFEVVRSALRCGMFHSIAHMDFVWRYIPWPKDNQFIYDELESTVQEAAKQNMALEINANGYLWSQANSIASGDPLDKYIDLIKKYNVAITIGSDAHEPQLVGKAFPEIINFLHRKGIDSFTCFTDGKASSHKLG